MTNEPIIVIGAGISGLIAAASLVFKGHEVVLVSQNLPQHSPSMGLHAGLHHLPEDLDVILKMKLVEEMNDFAVSLLSQKVSLDFISMYPQLRQMMDRLGVGFDITDEGLPLHYMAEGIFFNESHFSGFLTARKIIRKLDALIRQFIQEGKIKAYYHWQFQSAILDSRQNCRGVVVIHKPTMELKALKARSVIFCSGGYEGLFEETSRPQAMGQAVGALFQAGVRLANPEMIQYEVSFKGHQVWAAAAGLITALKGRYFVKKEGGPWYFLEDLYPQYKNALPQIVICRAFEKLKKLGHEKIYVNLDNDFASKVRQNWAGFDDYLKSLYGDELMINEIPVELAVSRTLGGLWVDENFMTNIPGILAAGRAQYQLNGASMRDGNQIAASLYSGLKAAENAISVGETLGRTLADVPPFVFDDALKNEFLENRRIMDTRGVENIYLLFDRLKKICSTYLGINRNNRDLQQALEQLKEVRFKLSEVQIQDRAGQYNEEILLYRSVDAIIPLVEANLKAALYRNESRGFHYKSDFPNLDDVYFLKTTRLHISAQGLHIEYEDIAKGAA